MKKLVYLSVLALTFTACSTEATSETEETAQQEEAVKADPVADKVMTMEVNGMSCMMNCGSSIKKALKGTGGVTSVEIDFEDGRATNVAKINFDSKLVNEQQMMEAVTSLYDGQYTIGNTSVSDLAEEVIVDEEDSSSEDEGSVVDAATSFIELPNLMDLFKGLFSL